MKITYLALVQCTNIDVTPVVRQWPNTPAVHWTVVNSGSGTDDDLLHCAGHEGDCFCTVFCPSITGNLWPTSTWTIVTFSLWELP